MHRPSVDRIPELVRSLYEIVSDLEREFPGRKFTPDGHLVGSIGEVLAAHSYGLELLPTSTPLHDAITPTGTFVQVKATQGKSVALRGKPDHLIVLFLKPNGMADEIYNGPGSAMWAHVGPLGRNGQHQISVAKLKRLMIDVRTDQRIPAA